MDWDRLVNDYLDDELKPEEVAALFQWVASHPDNAKRFAQAAFLHRSLEHRLSAMRVLEQARLADAGGPETPKASSSATTEPELSEAPQHGAVGRPARPTVHWGRWAGIAAALLLVACVVAYFEWPRPSPAHLLAVQNATWGSEIAAPKIGDSLPRGDCVIKSGFIQIGFDNGNQLLIQGPARFSITDSLGVALYDGSLTAVVTKPGRGLKITTPTARVTDLGTEFGVQSGSTLTRVQVFVGRVVVDQNAAGSTPTEISQGSGVEISATGIRPIAFDASAFTRTMPFDARPLDLIDLLAGGDGRGSAAGVGINAATGVTHETRAVTIRHGDHRYIQVKDNRVVDGCFIPDGNMPIDSQGHTFTFPATSLFSYGLIWCGPDIPWEGDLPLATTLPDEPPTSRILAMHSNNGFTLNLDAIRARHPSAVLTAFHARVGNSYRAAPGTSPANPLASVHVVVDGAARFEKIGFANVDPVMDINCPLSDNDHFLTLATTDGGDGNACDWVLWTHPELLVKSRTP
jgi:hypothetical protein